MESINDLTYNCENTSNYALQLALKTMQERCQQLQKRLATVEDENCSLRMKYCREKPSINISNTSKTEVELLQDKIGQLTKQKSQLAQNVMMVASENRNLWSRLSKLTDVNNSLGNQLLKINDALNQHKMNESSLGPIPVSNHLIRSKTFTQHSPRERSEMIKRVTDPSESEYVSLEEISLKLLNRLSKEKADLEEQCAQMAELQNDIEIDVHSIGFTYPEDSDEESSFNELTKHSENLHNLKDILLLQQTKLKSAVELIKKYHSDGEKFCINCRKTSNKQETNKIIVNKSSEEIEKKNQDNMKPSGSNIKSNSNNIRLCPMCMKVFNLNIDADSDFHRHVESHFVDDSITDQFEIVTTLGI